MIDGARENRLDGELQRIRWARSRARRVPMPLVYIVLVLLIVGMALWLINNYVPMAGSIRTILNVVVVIGTSIWVLKAVGLWNDVLNYKFPR
jgi:hypothetical protein